MSLDSLDLVEIERFHSGASNSFSDASSFELISAHGSPAASATPSLVRSVSHTSSIGSFDLIDGIITPIALSPPFSRSASERSEHVVAASLSLPAPAAPFQSRRRRGPETEAEIAEFWLNFGWNKIVSD